MTRAIYIVTITAIYPPYPELWFCPKGELCYYAQFQSNFNVNNKKLPLTFSSVSIAQPAFIWKLEGFFRLSQQK